MTDRELLNKAIYWFKVIAEDMERITTGNLPHCAATTKGRAIRAYEFLEKHKEEPVSIWHDANQQPTMYRKYLVRYSDGRVSGSWERHDDGFIPWKDVVKEHGFTLWCYTEDLLKL